MRPKTRGFLISKRVPKYHTLLGRKRATFSQDDPQEERNRTKSALSLLNVAATDGVYIFRNASLSAGRSRDAEALVAAAQA